MYMYAHFLYLLYKLNLLLLCMIRACIINKFLFLKYLQ